MTDRSFIEERRIYDPKGRVVSVVKARVYYRDVAVDESEPLPGMYL